MHLVTEPPDDVPVKAHEETHLVGWALPVLGRERVRRQPLHTDLDRTLDDVEQRVLTALVTHRAGKATLFRPPAVAVHDHRHVTRDQLARQSRRPGSARMRRRRSDCGSARAHCAASIWVAVIGARPGAATEDLARCATGGTPPPGR